MVRADGFFDKLVRIVNRGFLLLSAVLAAGCCLSAESHRLTDWRFSRDGARWESVKVPRMRAFHGRLVAICEGDGEEVGIARDARQSARK